MNEMMEGKHVMLVYDPNEREGKGFDKKNGFFVDKIDSIHTIENDDGTVDIIVNDMYRIDNVDIKKFQEVVVDIRFGYHQNATKDYLVEVR